MRAIFYAAVAAFLTVSAVAEASPFTLKFHVTNAFYNQLDQNAFSIPIPDFDGSVVFDLKGKHYFGVPGAGYGTNGNFWGDGTDNEVEFSTNSLWEAFLLSVSGQPGQGTLERQAATGEDVTVPAHYGSGNPYGAAHMLTYSLSPTGSYYVWIGGFFPGADIPGVNALDVFTNRDFARFLLKQHDFEFFISAIGATPGLPVSAEIRGTPQFSAIPEPTSLTVFLPVMCLVWLIGKPSKGRAARRYASAS